MIRTDGTNHEADHVVIELIHDLRTDRDALRARVEDLDLLLHEIAEVWAGSECGEPGTAQEAYAINIAKRMYSLAVSLPRKVKP